MFVHVWFQRDSAAGAHVSGHRVGARDHPAVGGGLQGLHVPPGTQELQSLLHGFLPSTQLSIIYSAVV